MQTEDLVVIDTPLQDLDMPFLTTVDGELTLIGTDLQLLDLPSLTEVTGSFKFSENTGNITQGGSSAPVAIGGQVTIRDNTSLSSLAYFPCLESMPYNLSILDNPSLQDLDGLSCLESVGGRVDIIGNTALQSVAALGQAAGATGLVLRDNTALTSLEGLEGITTLTDLEVSGHPNLTTSAGLEGLTEVDGDLVWDENGAPDLSGLSALATVSGAVSIQGNPGLEDLTGLPGELPGELPEGVLPAKRPGALHDPSGRYQTMAMLGRGGMGEVHRVWDRVLERAVAMKVINKPA